MYLCVFTGASYTGRLTTRSCARPSPARRPAIVFSRPVLQLPARPNMYLTRTVRRACASLSFPGRLFLICLLLDTFYLACVYETALLPSSLESENTSDSVNSSLHLLSSSSASAAAAASSPDSLSSSSSTSSSSTTTPSSISSSSSSLSSSQVVAPPPATSLLPSRPSSSASSSSPSSSSQPLSPSSSPSSGAVDESRNVNMSFNGTDYIPFEVDSIDPNRNGSQRVKNTHRSGSGNDSESGGGGGGGGGGGLDGAGGNSSHSGQSRNRSSSSSSSSSSNSNSGKQAVTSSRRAAGKAGKEFPLALIVASSTAAVSILLFFCLSYVWHTRQLDRRAQKLAIRLAAEADSDINKCSQCRPASAYLPARSISQYSASDSGGDDEEEEEEFCGGGGGGGVATSASSTLPSGVALDELDSLNEEDEEGGGSGGGGGSGSRSGSTRGRGGAKEDVAEDGSHRKPGGVGRTLGSRRGSRGRGRRSGSRSSRKWSGHSGGGGNNRSSLVTDKEILNHFASRRHSTFFI